MRRLLLRALAPVLAPVLVSLPALLAAGCLFQTAGGSSDTDNTVAVAGGIQDAGGAPSKGCALRLRREDYLSPFPAFGKRSAAGLPSALDRRDGVTDSLGRFSLDSLDTGEYVLEAAAGDSLGVLQRFHLGREPRLVNLLPRSLAPLARVSGTVLFRAGTYRVFVQAYGLERMVPVDMRTGRYSISLPAGDFTLRYVDPERARAFAKVRSVSLTAGQDLAMDTVILGDSSEPFHAWRHSSEIVINTTPGGADIDSDLQGFPLLVRLDASNFDFAQALPGGADIRFSKSDGRTPLPHQIESWDAAGRQAALWVRVDTLFGNRRTQGVYLYWGKPDALDASDGPSVFDPTSGHAGVWHLGDTAITSPGGYLDASGNGNQGTGHGLGDSSAVAGLIGGGARFAGRDQSIRIADAPSLKLDTGDFTLSAWVKAEALTRRHQVIAKRVESGKDYEFQVLPGGKLAAYPGPPGSGSTGFEAKGPVTVGKWHHIAFVKQGLRIALFLDGSENASAKTDIRNVATDSALWIGQDGTGIDEGWLGVIDEVRVAARAHGPDWLKMSHRSQAPGSKVLEWRRFP